MSNKIAIRVEKLYKTYQDSFAITNAWSLFKLPFVLFKRIFKRNDKPTLKGLSFEIPKGVKCGFLGKNGSGKTTTIKTILNTHYPDSGECYIYDEKVKKYYYKALKKIGSLVEKPNFYPYMTGFENLKIIGIIRSIPNKKIDEALKKVNLYEDKDKFFSNYSTGMKQRLGIAASLLANPDIFILDEPTSGLDPQGQAEVRNLIQSEYGNNDETLFLSSHILNEVEKLCDYVVIIDNGKEVTSGKVDELLKEDVENIKILTSNQEKALHLINEIQSVSSAILNPDGYLYFKSVTGSTPEISKQIIENGIKLVEMIINRQSLEHFFLKATEKEGNKK